MIKILLLVLALIAGLVVGPDLAGSQGYVLISVANQTIEMSVSTLFILVVVAFGALFLLEFILRKLFSLSSSTRGWFTERKLHKARQLTHQGMLKLLEGDWKQAEKFALKGANYSDEPMLNYVVAAEAAQHRGDVESRDHYLQQATDLDRDNLAIALTRAKLQYRQGQYEEALASLQGLAEQHPRNDVLLTLLKDTYIQLQDWQALLRLLPHLKRNKTLTDEQTNELEIKAECGVMVYLAAQKGSEGLLAHWNSLPRAARHQVPLITCLVEQLIAHQADTEAYAVLREQLKKHADESLIGLVPKLALTDYQPAIGKLNELAKADDSAAAHSALGQLYFRQEQWPQAREHFEKAISLKPNVSDYGWLVQTMEKLNDAKAANSLSREALKLALPPKN